MTSEKNPLQQVINRITEETLVANFKDSSNRIEYPHYKKREANTTKFHHICLREGFNLKSNYADKWFLSIGKEIVTMAYVKDLQIYGSVLEEYESAFEEPLESRFINVFLSKNSSKFRSQKLFSLEDVLCKLVASKMKPHSFPCITQVQKVLNCNLNRIELAM